MDSQIREIWKGLVSYANETVAEKAADHFRRTVARCVPWPVRVETFLGFMSDFRKEDFLKYAIEYQPSIDALLRWLCSTSKSSERELLRARAMAFLREHVEHIGGMNLIEVSYPDDPGARAQAEELLGKDAVEAVDEDGYTEAQREGFKYWWPDDGMPRDDSPLGIYTFCRSYRDLADPICEFLGTEYVKFRNDVYKKQYPQPTPIFVCPNCNKLVMPERIGKKKSCSACSEKARAERYREKAPPDEQRDYQWLYRLYRDLEQEEKPAAILMRLKNPSIQKRLKEIEARPLNSPRCRQIAELFQNPKALLAQFKLTWNAIHR